MRVVALAAVVAAVISVSIFVIVLLRDCRIEREPVVDAPTASDAPPLACSIASGSDGARVRCDVDSDCPSGYTCRCHIACKREFNTCESAGCPMDVRKCLSPAMRIATPRGEVPVSELAVGDVVWTQAADGSRVAAPIVRAVHLPVEPNHVMARITLPSKRELVVSPEHPMCNGPPVGDIAMSIPEVSVDYEPYVGAETFDILPAGDTGCYWVEGQLLGSTLFRPRYRQP